MNRKNVWMGMLLFSLIVNLLATVAPIKAAEGPLSVWFSQSRNGGKALIAEADSEVFLNFEYTGKASSYTAEITLEYPDGERTQLGVYKNTTKECIPLGKLPKGSYQADVVITTDGQSDVAYDSTTIDMLVGVPVIDKNPVDVITDPYQTISFSVSSQTEGVTYQWYKANELKDEGIPISGFVSNTLTITAENVSPEVTGTYYYCKVTANGHTINSSYAKLSIKGYEPIKPTLTPTATKTPTIDRKPTATPTPRVSVRPNSTVSPGNYKITKPMTAKAVYQKAKQCTKLTYPLIQGATYTIYRVKKGGGEFKPIATTKKNTYMDTIKTQGTAWSYRVYARTSTYPYMSNIVSVNVNMKPKIKSFQAKKSGHSVKLSWTMDVGTKTEVYVTRGKKFSKLGSVASKKKRCKVSVPKPYKKVKIKIRIYQKVGKKKYYSPYSKTKTIKF